MIAYLLAYKYIAFFLGMMIGGDIVLITGFYLAFHGTMDLRAVIMLAYFATVTSDFLWYWIGRKVPSSRISRMSLVARFKDKIDEASRLFESYSLKAVFYSKFVYGTRTVTQILAGAHKVDLLKYAWVDTLGTVCYGALLLLLTYSLKTGIENIKSTILNAQIIFAVLIVLILAINIWMQKTIKKRLYR